MSQPTFIWFEKVDCSNLGKILTLQKGAIQKGAIQRQARFVFLVLNPAVCVSLLVTLSNLLQGNNYLKNSPVHGEFLFKQ